MNLRHNTGADTGAATVGVLLAVLLAGCGLLLWWTLQAQAGDRLVGFCFDQRAWVATPDGGEVLRDYERDSRCGPPSASDEPASELA